MAPLSQPERAPHRRTDAEGPLKRSAEVTQVLEARAVASLAHTPPRIEQLGGTRQPTSHHVYVRRHADVSVKDACQLRAIEIHVTSTLGNAAPQLGTRFDGSADGRGGVDVRLPRRVASASGRVTKIGLERRQRGQRPAFDLKTIVVRAHVAHAPLYVGEPRGCRRTRRPPWPVPRPFDIRDDSRIEADRKTHVGRAVLRVVASEAESRTHEQDAALAELHALAAYRDIERSPHDESDAPAIADLLLRIQVDLVRSVVEPAQRKIVRRVEKLVTVHGPKGVRRLTGVLD